MLKRLVGAVAVLSVTIGALGMGYPQENEGQNEDANVLNTSQVTQELLEQLTVTQEQVVAVQEQGVENIVQLADGEAQIQDSTELLVASEVEAAAEAAKRKTTLTAEEIALLEKVVSAESRGESYEAQYTVACVVLNRLESDMFPNVLEEVIRESGQFSCVSNGAIRNVPITDSVRQAVASALDDNTLDANIMWFRSSYYHSFHTRAFQIGALFFSTV